jgi:hypothetical protein
MQGTDEKTSAKTNRRLAAVAWGLAAVVVLLVIFFFDVTPADLAYQVSRCLRCH